MPEIGESEFDGVWRDLRGVCCAVCVRVYVSGEEEGEGVRRDEKVQEALHKVGLQQVPQHST